EAEVDPSGVQRNAGYDVFWHVGIVVFDPGLCNGKIARNGMLPVLLCGCRLPMKAEGACGMKTNILKSELAGTWYTEDAEHLAREIDSYLDAVDLKPGEDVLALILPHAGYRYSGQVAAHGVKQVAGRSFSRVVVMGPSHRVALCDAVSIPDVSHIETPLGRIEIDRELVSRLLEQPGFESHLYVHTDEHSVQIELPFLQRALGGFKLVPVVCGQLDESGAQRIAAALLENIDAETLVVVSSDFTHYGRSFGYVPFKDDIPRNLENLDMGAFGQIEERNLSGFLQYVQNTGATICGRSPIAVLLAMLPADAEVQLLKYDNSGNLTGDWSHCVSYVSAAVSGRWNLSCSDGIHCEPELELSSADKLALLQLARHRITRKLRKDEPDPRINITPAMQDIMGAFVTLHKHGRLRGCIGEIFPRRELYEAVAEQAENAAFHDPRFPNLNETELDEVDIEISALTVPHRVESYEDIEIGRHGVVLYKGMYSAVFLPQVAPEQGWGIEETLTHLALKAGLGSNDWKSGCEFHVFEAIVFGEM
ncbi:MAG: AmmeMemoRadiSam system protein B, partial [Verrucomicrobiota bacterium]